MHSEQFQDDGDQHDRKAWHQPRLISVVIADLTCAKVGSEDDMGDMNFAP